MQVVFQHLEGRVGDDRVEVAGRGQYVFQMPGVMGAASSQGKQPLQDRAALIGDLVQGHASAAGLGQHGQKAGAGGRLQDLVARPDLGCQHRQGAQLRRRRELVQRDLLFTAPRVGEAQVGEIGQQGADLGRRIFQPADLRRQATQLQNQSRLDGVIGVAPDPRAFGVGAAEGHGHGVGHQPAVERPRAVQLGGQGPGGGQNIGGLV